MAGFRPVIVSLLLFGLFAIAFITFGIRLAQINDAPQSIADEPSIQNYANQLEGSLQQGYDDSYSAEVAISNSTISQANTGGLSLILDSVGGIWKTLKSVPVTIYNLTIGLIISNITGGEFGILWAVLGTILIITIIIAVIKLISQGEGE